MRVEGKHTRIVDRIGDLPAMPEVVSNVLEKTGDPSMNMEDVAKVIGADPGMTAKILRVSNSSYYGMRHQVATLKLALVILGVREVRNIVLGISVFESLKGGPASRAVIQEVWGNSLCIAAFCKRLAQHLHLRFQGEEFIAGLLTDIGKVVFFREFGTEYRRILQQAASDWRRLQAEEEQQYGYTHAQLAHALSERWNLPKSLGDALWLQYPLESAPLAEASDPQLAAVVRLAKLATLDDFSGKTDTVLSSVQEVEAWGVLEGTTGLLSPGERHEILQQCAEAVAKTPNIPF
jgi:HD-like signal output (HDOD) protein